MKLKNVKKETYHPITCAKGVERKTERNWEDTPNYAPMPISGGCWKITLQNNYKFAIGKYAIGFSRAGTQALKILSFNPSEGKLTYEVIDGANEPVLAKCLVEKRMPFIVYDRFADINITDDSLKGNTRTLHDQATKKNQYRVNGSKRVFKNYKLLDGVPSIGMVYTKFTVKDHAMSGNKYAIAVVNGQTVVINIISMDKKGKVIFEVLRGSNAHISESKREGFGSFEGEVQGSFKLYKYFRDAVHDYNFLVRS